MRNRYQPKNDGNQIPNNPPKGGSNAYKEDKKIILNVDVTNDIIQPLFDAIDLEKSDCEPVEMPTIPKNKYVVSKNQVQPLKDAIIKQPKVIARVSIFGEGLVFNIMDTCKGFIKPTKKHIKNLKKYFGIDVKLFDTDNEVKGD